MNTQDLDSLIARVPDYPTPGILFYDITPLLGDKAAFSHAVRNLAEPFMDLGVDAVVTIDARGFLFGAPLAFFMNTGLVLARKPDKLPRETLGKEFTLEYGSTSLHVHKDALNQYKRDGHKPQVLIADDVLATGGTALAACELVWQLGGDVAGVAVLIDLPTLGGSKRIGDLAIPVHALLKY